MMPLPWLYALAELTELEREAVIDHYLLGYTRPQLAARDGVSVNVVNQRILRGRARLVEQLKEAA